MIFKPAISLLSIVITNATASSLPILKRQENATAGSNSFASITPSKSLNWVPCYANTSSAKLGPISCARLIAPLDYTNSSGGEVQLAIVKLGASGGVKGRRTVFMNPGGPGDDPVEFITGPRGAVVRAQVGNDTDVIAIVPRGVGSTFPPITCDASDSSASQRFRDINDAQPGYANTSLSETYALGKALGLDRGSVTPNLIPYVGTMHVARDMDYVLNVLGQDKLSYLGYSYGSVLGASFAALFPEKIDRMVLDGVVDFGTWYTPENVPEYDIGDADSALGTFFQFCFEAGPDKCAFWYSSSQEIRDRFFEADRRLFANPIPIPGYGLLTIPTWRSGVFNALYRPEFFGLLAGIAAEIYNGTVGPTTQSYLKFLEEARSTGEPPLVDPRTGLKNGPSAALAIFCSDSGRRAKELGISELEAIYNNYAGVSQYFGGLSSQIEILCLGARLSAKERYTRKFENITTSHPILFVGNTADPTTPLRNAVGMSEAFHGSAVLTINGTGHISFSATQDSECATQWIVSYFRDGTLPPPGTVCDGKQAPFEQTPVELSS